MSNVEDYCLARSRRLRLRSADSRWLARLAIEQLPPTPPRDFQSHRHQLHARLKASLSQSVRERYGNPVVVWVLLNVVVPVVVRLVIDWWQNRKDP